ncbi:hypothetical protein FQA39_LY17857 [Lamprigera yunnana]|nr:hypothetical protein FQA39_LY17857 [Lamprigera yunnana]
MTEKSGSWSPVEIDNLITLVSERRDLYDQSSLGYSNLNTTNTLWRQISSQFLNRNEQELRKKWQILRTGYRTRRGEKYLPSRSGAKPIKKWVYFDSLMFLEQYITERNTSTYLKKVSNNTTNRSLCNNVSSQSYAKAYMLNDDGILVSDEAEESDQNTEEYNSQTNPHVDDETYSPSVSDAPSTPEGPTSGSRKKRKSKLNPADKRFLAFFEKKHESTAKREKSSNELFLASLLEDMNKLQQDDLRKFKIIMLKDHSFGPISISDESNLPNIEEFEDAQKMEEEIEHTHRKNRQKRIQNPTKITDDSQNYLLKNLQVNTKLRETVFPKMRADDISLVAKRDILICEFGKMREIRKLHPSIQNLFQALQPQNFDLIVEATKIVAQHDSVQDKFGSPTYAMNICTSLKECCNIAIVFALKRKFCYSTINSAQAESNLKTMVHLLGSNWKFDISNQAADDLNMSKWNKVTIIKS